MSDTTKSAAPCPAAGLDPWGSPAGRLDPVLGHLRRVAPRGPPHRVRRRCRDRCGGHHRSGRRHGGHGQRQCRRRQPGRSGEAAADASAASAEKAKAAATQAQAGAAQAESPQQKLKELQSLYDQKLISASDYEAAKKKILAQLTQ